ncbi:MAG: hypothetical protein PHN31_05280, partial [Candidatus Gracilibacteria bacterium]|nr:hypothetical protein [Candidatus Gracilibacteria bacterium]
MNNIRTAIEELNVVYSDSDKLALGLANKSDSTKTFLDNIESFFMKFNKKYNTNITFEDVLNIYFKGENNLEFEQSIMLCKALLEYIQTHGIEITSEKKIHLIRFATTTSSNKILISKKFTEKERNKIKKLSTTISNFIEKVRDYFRILIPDSTSLQDANVDKYINLLNLNQEKDITSEDNQYKIISNGTIKISESLAINLNITDKELCERILSLTNQDLKDLLNYIYDKIKPDIPGEKEYIIIAKFIFDDKYETQLGQIINNVLEKGKLIGQATLDKINFDKIRKTLITDSITDTNLDNTDTKSTISKNLAISNGPLNDIINKLDLNNNKQFKNDLISLEKDEIHILFSELENYLITHKIAPSESSAVKLANMIQKSDEKKASVYNKIIKFRKTEGKLSEKFITNNINLNKLKKLIQSFLDTIGETIIEEENQQINFSIPEETSDITIDGETTDTTDKVPEKTIKESDIISKITVEKIRENKKETFEFTYIDNETQKEISINIELNGKKDISGFVYSLNYLIQEECKRQDIEGLIKEFNPEDFINIELNSLFFDNVKKNIKDKNILEMFFFDQELLDNFLSEWHKKVIGNPLNIVDIKKLSLNSREAVLSFVNLWQENMYEIVRKTNKKKNYRAKRRQVTINLEIFEGINSLTTDLLSKIDNNILHPFFAIMPKAEVQKLLEEFIDEIKNN